MKQKSNRQQFPANEVQAPKEIGSQRTGLKYLALPRTAPPPVETPLDQIKWIIKPQPERMERIVELLKILGVPDVDKAVAEIKAFKRVDEFEMWMNQFKKL